MRPAPVLAALFAALAIALAAPPGAWAIHEALPGPVPPACGAFYPGQCLIQTRLGGFSLSPLAARAGHRLTGTVSGSCVIGYGNNDPCPIDWSEMTAVGRVDGGCGRYDKTCTVRIAEHAASSAYRVINVGITNAQGTGYSSDYYAVVGHDQAVIEGRLANKDADPVPGVDMSLYGPSNYTASTGPDGYYAADVDAGRYRVIPEGHSISSRTPPRFHPERSDVDAPADRTVRADFTVEAGLVVTLELAQASVAADGFETVSGTLKVTEFGVPKAGVTVALWPQEKETSDQAVSSGPRVLVCGTGGRIWPTGTISSPDGLSVNVVTDATGRYRFTLDVGTVPGSWTLTAWALDDAGTLITHDLLNATDEQTLTVTPLTPAPVTSSGLEQFVQNLNAAGPANAWPGLVSSDPTSLIDAFEQLTVNQGQFKGFAYALGNGNSPAIVVYPAANAPAIQSNGDVVADSTDLVLQPSEWASVPTISVTSLASAIADGRVQDLPSFSQWAAGTSVPGWSGSAQSMQVPSANFQYFGWPYPSTSAGACL